MTKDVRREEMSKFAALPGCTYNDEIYLVGIEPKFIVCHPARDVTETITKLFKGNNNTNNNNNTISIKNTYWVESRWCLHLWNISSLYTELQLDFLISLANSISLLKQTTYPSRGIQVNVALLTVIRRFLKEKTSNMKKYLIRLKYAPTLTHTHI